MGEQQSFRTPGRMRGALLLVITAVLAGALLSGVQRLTAPRIADNLAAERLKSLRAVLPADSYDNEPHLDSITALDPALLGSDKPMPVYRARLEQQPVAAVLTVIAPNGFSGPIKILVGIGVDGTVTGVRTVEHRETPGLGDKIEVGKSNWTLGFGGLQTADPLTDEWVLRRDGGEFDQITGATVSSRAVLNAVRNAVLYFDAHRQDIFRANDETKPE